MDLNRISPSVTAASEPLPLEPNQLAIASVARNGSKKIVRELGLKVTDQRLHILETIRLGPRHFTAQEIFERVQLSALDSRETGSGIGFATVYRFLRTLTEHAYVTEVRMGGMPARYEWAGKRHHDHLTCVSCHKIVEFENSKIERLQELVAKEFGFTLTHHLLELYGHCSDCRAKI